MKHRNQAKNFLEIKIGDTAEFEVKIEEKNHLTFSELVGDYSPIHFEKEYYTQTKYGQKIGYGFLLMSFLSRLYGEYLPGGSSICIKQEGKWIKPYFIGDTIKIAAIVINKVNSTHFVEVETKMYRNSHECVFIGKGLVQILDIDFKSLK